MAKSKKLALSSEVIRTLSAAEIDAVGGNMPPVPGITTTPSIIKCPPSQGPNMCIPPSEVPGACDPSRRRPC